MKKVENPCWIPRYEAPEDIFGTFKTNYSPCPQRCDRGELVTVISALSCNDCKIILLSNLNIVHKDR